MLWVTHDQVEAMTMADTLAVMREGRLEGIGTPRDLYERPANIFIASFLGSPPMNLIPGESKALGGLMGKERLGAAGDIVVGVRPEDIDVGGGNFQGSVLFCENLGSESHLTIGTGTGQDEVSLTARITGETPRIGERVSFSIDKKRLSFFERGSGKRIET
jgi:ABC-type sugar transport system ATPase subunit